MGTSVTANRIFHLDGILRRLFCCILSLSFFGSLILALPILAQAADVNKNPGDQYVFGSDSPVYEDGNIQIGQALSGNICFWTENGFIKFKDLSKNDPGRPLFSTPKPLYYEYSPVISRDAIYGNTHRLVWVESHGGLSRIYYRDLDFDNLQTINGYTVDNSTLLSNVSSYQSIPSISSDGSKVAWQDNSSSNSQTYLYDFSTRQGYQVFGNSAHKQVQPSADNEWVVWTENWDYWNGAPTKTVIYAKRIGNSDPPVQIAQTNSITAGYASAGRNNYGEPVVVYAASLGCGLNGTTCKGEIHTYNLAASSNPDVALPAKAQDVHPFPMKSPRIDGDKIVWQVEDGANYNVQLYDLSTNICQNVSSNPTTYSGDLYPKVSASSKYIVWSAVYNSSPRESYYNQIGDTAQVLANKYAPELHFRHDAFHNPQDLGSYYSDFEPRPIGIMLNDLDEAKLVTTNREIPKPTVQDLIDNPGSAWDLINNPGSVNYLDLPGSPTNPFDNSYYDDYNRQITDHASDYPVMSYSRVLNPAPDKSDKTVIQYWMLYYYNNWFNNHEGDWEMVEVVLDNKLNPECVAYSQHGVSQLKYWNEDGLEKNGGHPKDYVAEGSHANIFDGGIIDQHMVWTTNDINSDSSWFDLTGDRTSLIPSVDLAWVNEGWVNYAGLWGQRSSWWWTYAVSGPPGPQWQPSFQNKSPWNDPYGWAVPSSDCDTSNADGNDVAVTACSPVEISIYDQQGNHVGKNASGGIDKQIPGAEYFERSTNHSKNIIIHGADSSNNYRLEVTGTGTGNADLKIHVPSSSSNQLVKNQYLTVPVTASMKGSIDLAASPTATFQLDNNGDGVVDQEKQPDVSETKDADFTAPSQISDLHVSTVDPQAVTLQWTAPGDDGQQGTAFKYELRYCSSAVTDTNWNDCKPVAGLNAPQASGLVETASVQGLAEGNTYYFAIKAWDDGGNISPISNAVSAHIPIRPTTAGTVAATPASISSIYVSAPYTADENANGAAIIQYKLSGDSVWNEYGTLPHPANSAIISGLAQNASYDVYVTYLDPDGVNGSATQLLSGVYLPAPPATTNVLPSGMIYGDSAAISADLSAGYGVNPNSVSVTLDGNVLSGCSANSTAVSCPASGLTYGNHSIGGSFADNAGNTASISGNFSVGDNTPPSVTNVQPMETVYGGATTITAQVSDSGISSGINVNSVTVSLDGNILQGCTASITSVSCDAHGVLYGTHTISGSVADNDGNSSPIMGSFYMIEWSIPSIMYQSPAAISQPSLYRLSDGRTMLAYTDNLSLNAINFRLSSDNGLSWQIPTGSSGHIPCAAGVHPSITQLSSGIVVIAYAEYYRNPLNGSYSWILRVTQSSDLINWSWPSFASSGNSLAPSLKTLSNGQILLAHTKNIGSSADLYATKGTFTGSYWSWSTDSLVYGGAQYDSKPGLADAGNGDLLVAFFSGSNWSADRNTWLSRDINLVRSTDNGLTWSQTPTTVYANTGSADFWPTLLRLNNGSILCAFTTSDQGSVNQLNIKLISSGDGGLTWGDEQMISVQGHSESWPALVQQSDGSILAVWDSDPGQASGVYYLYSSKLIMP